MNAHLGVIKIIALHNQREKQPTARFIQKIERRNHLWFMCPPSVYIIFIRYVCTRAYFHYYYTYFYILYFLWRYTFYFDFFFVLVLEISKSFVQSFPRRASLAIVRRYKLLQCTLCYRTGRIHETYNGLCNDAIVTKLSRKRKQQEQLRKYQTFRNVDTYKSNVSREYCSPLRVFTYSLDEHNIFFWTVQNSLDIMRFFWKKAK